MSTKNPVAFIDSSVLIKVSKANTRCAPVQTMILTGRI